MGESELSGVCFRFKSDLDIVCCDRKCMAMAEFFHQCCTVHGVAEFELVNHLLIQKQYPPAHLLAFCHFLF